MKQSLFTALKAIRFSVVLSALILICHHSSLAQAQTLNPHGEHTHAPSGMIMGPQSGTASEYASAATPGAFKKPIPDFALLDQNGRRVRFYTDLMKGKVVVLSFFFTNCTFVCDVQGRNLTRLQARLSDRLGREVFLISVTRDPDVDTPEQLARWGRKYGVKPGWSLVTGNTEEIGTLLARFISESPGQLEAHSATIFVGNDVTGQWFIANGLAPPDELIKLIDQALAQGHDN